MPIPCPSLETIAADLPSILILLQTLRPAVTVLQPVIGNMLLSVRLDFGALSVVLTNELNATAQTTAVHLDPLIIDTVSQIGKTSRLGLRVLDVLAEYLGGKALADEKWDGNEGEGVFSSLTAKTLDLELTRISKVLLSCSIRLVVRTIQR